MLPEIKLDTDMFQTLIEEARTMLAGIYPQWTDYNYHDPGMTFLELFAWLKENQQFFMEQLGPEHYEQFFRLLGFQRRGRRPARLLAQPRLPFSGHIPSGSRFMAGGMVFETVTEENLLKNGISRILFQGKGEEMALVNEYLLSCLGQMRFFPFGREPEAGAASVFCFDSPLRPGLLYHIYFQMEEGEGQKRNPPGTEPMIPLAVLEWSYHTDRGWEELHPLEDETENFLFSGRVSFLLEREMTPMEEGGYGLRVALKENHYDLPPVFSGVSMNQIVLLQKETWEPEGRPLLLAEGNGFPVQEYSLPGKEPIAASVELEIENTLCPGSFSPWKRVEDFSGCGPSDCVYVVDEEQGTVRFGDGYRGMPPEGAIRLVSMEETRGEAGNVKTKTVIRQKNGGAEFEVSAELQRGCSREGLRDAILRLRTETPKRERAVTAEDYEEMVKETPGLIIYSCRVLREKWRDNQVSIVVRPGDGRRNIPLSPEYRRNILRHLDKKRLIGTRLQLLAPEYIEVRLYLEVSVMPQYRRAREMILETVEQWFSRLGTSFGETISYGALYGLIDSMACVRRLRVMNMEAASSSVRRNQGGDLIPPPGGVFLLKQVDYTAMNE